MTLGDLLVLVGKTEDRDQRMASHLRKALRPTGASQDCHDMTRLLTGRDRSTSETLR